MIEFLLNNKLVQLSMQQVDLTVLDYLRDHRQSCGTKEGCASGDCGACTVVLGEVGENRINYRNINSCITFVGALHGKQLITVEHLKHDGELHSVQNEMVDKHGSQCGFCTPGFIMSMFAHYKSTNSKKSGEHQKEEIEEFLAGNLCRCTGYRPIIDAAMAASSNPQPDHFSEKESQTIQQLKKINNTSVAEGNDFFIPKTTQQLAELLTQHPEARLLAGGTDLALEVTQHLKQLDKIIYLGSIDELKEIISSNTHHQIGSAVSLVELDNLMSSEYPQLSALLKRFGSRQVRNNGTVGGNIANASPIGDLPPVLLALNASVKLQSQTGSRVLPLDDFFLDYRKTAMKSGEFIHSINIPRSKENTQLIVYKISKRIDDDISAVCFACQLEISNRTFSDIRIACGGMAAIPKRAKHCEQALLGQPLTTETIAHGKVALNEDFSPIADVRASSEYRMKVTENLLDRLSAELENPVFPTQVTQL